MQNGDDDYFCFDVSVCQVEECVSMSSNGQTKLILLGHPKTASESIKLMSLWMLLYHIHV